MITEGGQRIGGEGAGTHCTNVEFHFDYYIFKQNARSFWVFVLIQWS